MAAPPTQKLYCLQALVDAYARLGKLLDYVSTHEYVGASAIGSDVKQKLPGLWLKSPVQTFRPRNQPACHPNPLQWHPRKNAKLPALPDSFTANELAAFWLAGGGVFMHEAFTSVAQDETGDPAFFTVGTLDENVLAELGENADEERQALREADRLYREAKERFGPSDEGVRHAAEWLLHTHAENGSDSVPEQQSPKNTGVPSMPTDDICDAFAGVGRTTDEWRTTLTKNRPDWLMKKCHAAEGKAGVNPVQARWWPLEIAKALASGKSRASGVVAATKLDAAFRKPALRLWLDGWRAIRDDHPEWGD